MHANLVDRPALLMMLRRSELISRRLQTRVQFIFQLMKFLLGLNQSLDAFDLVVNLLVQILQISAQISTLSEVNSMAFARQQSLDSRQLLEAIVRILEVFEQLFVLLRTTLGGEIVAVQRRLMLEFAEFTVQLLVEVLHLLELLIEFAAFVCARRCG